MRYTMIKKVIINKSALERKSFENFLKEDDNLYKEIRTDNFLFGILLWVKLSL